MIKRRKNTPTQMLQMQQRGNSLPTLFPATSVHLGVVFLLCVLGVTASSCPVCVFKSLCVFRTRGRSEPTHEALSRSKTHAVATSWATAYGNVECLVSTGTEYTSREQCTVGTSLHTDVWDVRVGVHGNVFVNVQI